MNGGASLRGVAAVAHDHAFPAHRPSKGRRAGSPGRAAGVTGRQANIANVGDVFGPLRAVHRAPVGRQRLYALHHLFALQDVRRRQRHRAADRMGGVGVTVREFELVVPARRRS